MRLGCAMQQRLLVKLRESSDSRKILDFDIENRPLSYWFGDVTTGEITAIAWSFLDPEDVQVRALGEVSMEEMLRDFVEAYDEADMVTGHYIRRHDLPVINAMLLEAGMPLLSNKKTEDTKLDLARLRHLAVSQEALGAMLGIEAPKVGMNQLKWREANRLTDAGIALTKQRVVGDVLQHMQLREALLLRGMLKPPSMWNSIPGGVLAELVGT